MEKDLKIASAPTENTERDQALIIRERLEQSRLLIGEIGVLLGESEELRAQVNKILDRLKVVLTNLNDVLDVLTKRQEENRDSRNDKEN